MATQVKLAAEKRVATGRSAVRKLKAGGLVPAVIYGARQEPQNLQVSRQLISQVLGHASGENILVELEIVDGSAKATRTALIQEVQHNPLGGAILHVDFRAVSMDEMIVAEIPVQSVGEANGVKNYGGLLEQNMRSIEVECLPKDLPDLISVDVTNLNVGDSIHVRDLQLPAGVSAKNDPELTIFTVAAPTVEEEKPAAAAAPVTPEVIKEKKAEPAAETKKPGAGEGKK